MNRKSPLKQKKPLWKYCAEKKAKERAKLTKETPIPPVGARAFPALKKPPGAILVRKSKLRKQSVKRGKENDRYLAMRIDFLRRFPICAACLTRGISPAPSAQIHHQRGRVSKLLTDERFFIAICAECHVWCHSFPNEARELGLIAPVGEWNRVPRD